MRWQKRFKACTLHERNVLAGGERGLTLLKSQQTAATDKKTDESDIWITFLKNGQKYTKKRISPCTTKLRNVKGMLKECW
jgi:hypothetical protein